MKPILLGALSFVLSAYAVCASDESVVIGDVEMPELESSDAFKQVKKKLGRWEGQMTQGLTGKVFDVA